MTSINPQIQTPLNFTQQQLHTIHNDSHFNSTKSTTYPTKLISKISSQVKNPTKISKNSTKNPEKWVRKKQGYVDYDKGQHHVSEYVSGLRKDDIPRSYRIKVQADKFQKDWSITQVVQKIMALKNGDDIEGVLNHWVGRFARKNYPVLIKELTQLGSIEHAVQVFHWMKNQKNYCPRNDIYNMMIRLHARHNHIDQARGLFFEMQKWKCKPDAETYNALINAHGRAGQWRWAMNIMEDMLRAAVPPSRSTYNNLINACGSCGNWREALKISKKMTDNGVGPDLVTHNIILSAYKTENWDKAYAIFQEMEANDIQPDVVACSAMMRAFNKGTQPSKVLSLLEYMKENNIPISEAIHFEVISACSLLRDWKTAINQIKIMEPILPELSIGFVNHLLQFLGKSGKTETMMKMFLKIVASGAEINYSTYSVLLKSLLAAGNWRKYIEVLQWMEEAGLQPSVAMYHEVLFFAQRSGGPDLAAMVQANIGSLKRRPQNRNQLWSSPHSASELTDECELHPQILA